jgi:hypothetical protein
MLFIFLITFLVVGPRRIIRGVRAIQDWVRNGFRRASKSKTARNTKSVMRGFGRMIGYYRDLNKEKEKKGKK